MGNAQIGFGRRNNWMDLMCSTEIKDRSVSDSQSLAGGSERVIMSIMKTGWRGRGMARIWGLVFIVEIMRCVEFGIAAKDPHDVRQTGIPARLKGK